VDLFSVLFHSERDIPGETQAILFVLDRGYVYFGELRKAEVRRSYLLGTRVNKGKSKGWAMGKPTSNSGKEKELLRR
jgi:hypothetical protein